MCQSYLRNLVKNSTIFGAVSHRTEPKQTRGCTSYNTGSSLSQKQRGEMQFLTWVQVPAWFREKLGHGCLCQWSITTRGIGRSRKDISRTPWNTRMPSFPEALASRKQDKSQGKSASMTGLSSPLHFYGLGFFFLNFVRPDQKPLVSQNYLWELF